MRKIITCCLLSVLSISLNAQEEVEKSNSTHKIGLSASTTTGAGLTYQYFHNNSQVKLAVLPLLSKGYSLMGLGLTYKHRIRDFEKWDIFLYAGGSYYFEIPEDPFTVKTGSVGFSFDLSPNELFTLALESGYGVYVFGEADNWQTHLSVGVGLDFNISHILNKK